MAVNELTRKFVRERDNFIWTTDGLNIVGTTEVGRATCHKLDVNDESHNQGFIQESRQLWIQGGWHPPSEDPRYGNVE